MARARDMERAEHEATMALKEKRQNDSIAAKTRYMSNVHTDNN